MVVVHPVLDVSQVGGDTGKGEKELGVISITVV